jgi:DNA polymerase-1
MHAGIRNCGTVTRRPTGGNPNILQVSKGEVREIFLPRYDDHVICALDFNGQELRITGSEANDPVLIDCYTGLGTAVGEDGIERAIIKDVHSITATLFAEAVFMRELGTRDVDLSYEGFRTMLKGKEEKLAKVAALCRKMAKAVNFLIIYGGGPSTLAINIGILIKFAEEIMELVFEGYPRLRPWQRETIAFAERRGFVHTAFGTRKHLTADIVSRDGGKKSRAERQAINQTIQGCAADILKRVLAEAWTTRLFHDTGARLIAPVYDEVVSSVPVSSAFEYCSRLQDLMNLTPPGHKIPMMAEVSIGPNWGSVIELGARPSEKAVIECIEGFRKGATK